MIDSVKRDLLPEEGISLIYNQSNIILGLDGERIEDDLPFFYVQAQTNCFVKCYEPGSSIRFGEKYEQLYKKLVLCQENNANLLVKRCKEEYGRDCRTLIDQFIVLAKEPVPNSQGLQDHLKKSYLQKHQYMLRNTIGESNTQLTENYIPLRFDRKEKSIDLEDFFSNESRVLLVADAGCGKSTVCQYVTYLWARGELWRNQYEWIFYIKMPELNSSNYPPPSNQYASIDIIETECFQGYKLNHIEKQKIRISI